MALDGKPVNLLEILRALGNKLRLGDVSKNAEARSRAGSASLS